MIYKYFQLCHSKGALKGGSVVKISKFVLTLVLCCSIVVSPLPLNSNPDTEKKPQETPAPYKTDNNKERYFDFLDYVHEVDWKNDENNEAINGLLSLPKELESFFFDTYLYTLGFYDRNYTKLNYELKERVARDNPGRENDLNFLIKEIIDENAWAALKMGFIAGGASEALLARLGKKAPDVKEKYKSLASFLGKTAIFATMDVLITTQYFLNAYFQIANLLGWTKGNNITRQDAKNFLFQVAMYALYVYGADVTFAAGLQTLGKKLLSGMVKHKVVKEAEEKVTKEVIIKYITAAEMDKLGRGFSFMLSMAFSKQHWREFWGLNLRTVGWNEGRKRAFWSAVEHNAANVPMGPSAYAGYLATSTSLYAKVFHIFAQGGISALHSYLGVKAGMTGLIAFFYPPLTSIPKYGAADFKKIVDNGIIFKLIANSIIANTPSVQGIYSDNYRTPIIDVFTESFKTIHGFEGEGFKSSHFYLELKTKIENKEPFVLTQQEKELYYSINMESNLIAYLFCYYFYAYDGFSITDSHNLQQTSHVEAMFEERDIEHNEIQLYFTMQEQFGQQLFSERKLFAKDPQKYVQDKEEPFPEMTALHYLIDTNIVPPHEIVFNTEPKEE